MIDINAPIMPYEEMGGIKLYSTIKELKEILSGDNVKATVLNNLWIRYDMEDYLHLLFNLVNYPLVYMQKFYLKDGLLEKNFSYFS